MILAPLAVLLAFAAEPPQVGVISADSGVAEGTP